MLTGVQHISKYIDDRIIVFTFPQICILVFLTIWVYSTVDGILD